MSTENKRQSFRCPLPDMPIACIMRKNGRALTKSQVRIFDESAGGYGIQIEDKPDFEKGENLVLVHNGFELICRVMHCHPTNDGMFHAGLTIIDEIEQAPETQNVAGISKSEYFRSFSISTPLIMAMIIMATAIAVFLYRESTTTYRDEFGRKYNGGIQTAFDNFCHNILGRPKNKNKYKSKRKS